MFVNNYFLAKRSLAALLPAILSPLYVGALFLYGSTLENIMRINVGFMIGLLVVYLIAYTRRFSYNGAE
jgi:hypothetical protein